MTYSAFDRLRPWLAWGSALGGIGLIAMFTGSPRQPRAISDLSDEDTVGHGGSDVGPIEVTVDANRSLGPINPYIYGMAQPSHEHFKELRLKLWRWGGNPSSRYNWEKGNCWNAAADWGFRNGNYDNVAARDRTPSGVVDRAIAEAKASGSDAIITIPTLGWVARNDDNATFSTDVPAVGGPPVTLGSDAIAGYDPASNRSRVSQRSLPRKGAPFMDPPNLHDDFVYQDEWVYHLSRRFGSAANGGVRFYAMDNEPDLWSSTHRDMHPVRPGYDELLKQFEDYADSVKYVDPTAQVTGPVSSGWTGLFYSPLDQGIDNYATAADRGAHGGLPFLAWFLRETAKHDRRAGRRSLDVLDVHFYPQGKGIYGGATDDITNRKRLRSTRALWDTTYVDESWIAAEVDLLPRLRNWVDKYYPGTRIGLTEWNWGADGSLSGALAIADVLGILGRERVDIACYWMAPAVGSPGFYAWKMYRNADGRGSGFGDTAVEVVGGNTGNAACFASIDRLSGYPVVMFVNKSPTQSKAIQLNIKCRHLLSVGDVYRYSAPMLQSIAHLPKIRIIGGHATLRTPPYSITLLRCR